jgi:hypothetical protein
MLSLADLKPQHQRVVLGYIQHGNATRAWLEAGYTGTREAAAVSAHRLLRSPKVADIIERKLDAARKRIGERVILSKDKVLRDLEVCKDLAIETGDVSPAIKATELQGKEIGMFRDGVDLTLRGADDDALILSLAGGNLELARALRAKLVVGEEIASHAPAAQIAGPGDTASD